MTPPFSEAQKVVTPPLFPPSLPPTNFWQVPYWHNDIYPWITASGDKNELLECNYAALLGMETSFSHDVIVTTSVVDNKEMAAMLLDQNNPSNYDFCYVDTTWLLVTWINLKPSIWFKFISVVIRIGPSMLVIKQKLMPVWALLLRVHDRILASGRHSRNREKIGKTRNDALLNIEVSSALHKNWYHWE